jgi:hypothetical protein
MLLPRGTESSTKLYYVLQMGFFRRKKKEELEALTKVCIGDWKEVTQSLYHYYTTKNNLI